ncbi:MAG: glycosyltransferase family 4 protein [Patescibacteria group bacterium]
MKILLATGIYPPDIGGPATYTRAIARALNESGHEITVICYADKINVNISDEEKFKVLRVSREQSRRARYREYEEEAYKIAQCVDIVYLQGPVSEGYPGTRAAQRAGKPTVMKVVGDYAWEMYMQSGSGKKELLDEFITHRHFFPPKVWRIESIERETAKYASRIITPSHYLKSIVEKWGVPSDKIEVILNAGQHLPGGLSRQEARKAFCVEDKSVLFTVVRAVPWKNIDFIIRLLPKLKPDIVLYIAGDGPSLDDWKAVAEKEGVKDRVQFLGKLDRPALSDWYRAADLFVLPSGYEGYPNVIPEAVSMGLPCVVSDKGGNPETRESFPDFVTVLPYLNDQAWIEALSHNQEVVTVAPSPNDFSQMIQSTLNALQSALPTPHPPSLSKTRASENRPPTP